MQKLLEVLLMVFSCVLFFWIIIWIDYIIEGGTSSEYIKATIEEYKKVEVKIKALFKRMFS